MNKALLTVLFVVGLLIGLGSATAAIEGCVDSLGVQVADNSGAWPSYNDTGTTTFVTDGNICINVTDYDVDPTDTLNCDEYYNYVDGECAIDTYYVGFLDDGSGACSVTGWVSGGSAFVAEGYIVNDTIASAPSASYVTNTGEAVPAKDDCLNAYTLQGPTGYCDGAGALDTDSSLSNVTEGDVCAAGSSITANSTLNCGLWYECVADETSYGAYYTGYLGDGTNTCTDTDWVTNGLTYNLLDGTKISFTANSALSCEAGLVTDDAGYISGLNNARNLAYAGFGLLAVGILALIAFGLLQVFKGGNVDFMSLTLVAVGTGVVIVIAFVIIYYVSKALGVG